MYPLCSRYSAKRCSASPPLGHSVPALEPPCGPDDTAASRNCGRPPFQTFHLFTENEVREALSPSSQSTGVATPSVLCESTGLCDDRWCALAAEPSSWVVPADGLSPSSPPKM